MRLEQSDGIVRTSSFLRRLVVLKDKLYDIIPLVLANPHCASKQSNKKQNHGKKSSGPLRAKAQC